MQEYVLQEKVQVHTSRKCGETPGEEDEKQEQYEDFVEIIGAGNDSEDARNRWIEEVEKLLKYEAFERGELHMDRKFDEVMYDGDYGLDRLPRWMVVP